MKACSLVQKKCRPCEGGTVALLGHSIREYLAVLPTKWEVKNDQKIFKKFKFKDFVAAIKFVNQVADIAENEGHHPDIQISYNKVLIELWTHAINGLSENDFILASKVDQIKSGTLP